MATTISIENARIGFRNFEGRKTDYVPMGGKRSFCVFLENDKAIALQEDGWNIKWTKPRDEDDESRAYLQVAVSFQYVPPRVVLIQHGKKRLLDEEDVLILDWAEIENVDLIINPYEWDVNGKSGIKAYLKSMYVTLVEDEFEVKYRSIPESTDSVSEENDSDLPF